MDRTMGVGIARLPTLPASRSSIALIVCPPHACLSLRGFDQQLDANDIAREDATPIQRSGEPHPKVCRLMLAIVAPAALVSLAHPGAPILTDGVISRHGSISRSG